MRRLFLAFWLLLASLVQSAAPVAAGPLPFASPMMMKPAAAGAFTPASLFIGGFAGGWWDPSDLTHMWKDTAGTIPVTADGDAVARIDDKSGNGNNLLQSTSGSRPLYKTSGGKSWLQFDGTDDYMRATFAMGTSWNRISAVQFPSLPHGNRQWFGGVTVNECLFDGAGGASMFNGTGTGASFVASATTDYVITEIWEPTTKIAADNGSYATSAFGAVNPGGLTVGASNSTGSFAGLRLYGLVMVNKSLNGTEVANTRTFMGALQGRVL